jgi:hypothetical protein
VVAAVEVVAGIAAEAHRSAASEALAIPAVTGLAHIAAVEIGPRRAVLARPRCDVDELIGVALQGHKGNVEHLDILIDAIEVCIQIICAIMD